MNDATTFSSDDRAALDRLKPFLASQDSEVITQEIERLVEGIGSNLSDIAILSQALGAVEFVSFARSLREDA